VQAMRRCSRLLTPFREMLGAVVTLFSLRDGSTRPRLKVHTVYCRVRRKRQRLASNGSIESDAVIRVTPRPKCLSPRHFR
jgi:hypothetical protein